MEELFSTLARKRVWKVIMEESLKLSVQGTAVERKVNKIIGDVSSKRERMIRYHSFLLQDFILSVVIS